MLLSSVRLEINRDEDQNYLKIRIPESKEAPVYGYQIEMIVNNPSELIIPFEYHRKDHDYFFYYNILNRISLKDYMEKHRFSKNEFIHLLLGITENILECRKLLLNERNFIINEEHIYLAQGSAVPGLVYIPAGRGLFRLQDFKDFIIRLIARASFNVERGEGSFLYRIIGYLKEDGFSLPGFKKLLEDLRDQKGADIDYDAFSMNNDGRHTLFRENERLCDEKNVSDEKNINKGERKADILNGQTLAYAAVSQAVIIILAVLIDRLLKSRGSAQAIRYGLITIAVLVYDAIVLKLLIFTKARKPDKSKMVNKPEIFSKSQVLDNPKSFNKSEMFNESGMLKRPEMFNKREVFDKSKTFDKSEALKKPEAFSKSEMPYKSEMFNKPEINSGLSESRTLEENMAALGNGAEIPDQNSDNDNQYSHPEKASDRTILIEETSLLIDGNEPRAFLVCREKGAVKEFRLNKDRIIIGRNPDVCDIIIDNKTVGRIHAEILKKDGSFYIIDKNSRNGTYLNNRKLDGGVEYRLNNGDTIVFANAEYGFIG